MVAFEMLNYKLGPRFQVRIRAIDCVNLTRRFPEYSKDDIEFEYKEGEKSNTCVTPKYIPTEPENFFIFM